MTGDCEKLVVMGTLVLTVVLSRCICSSLTLSIKSEKSVVFYKLRGESKHDTERGINNNKGKIFRKKYMYLGKENKTDKNKEEKIESNLIEKSTCA